MATFSSGDDRNNELIQAADAVVFEIRRALKVALRLSPDQLRKQFDILADAHKVFLIQHTNKKSLASHCSNSDPG
jgi:hypothetical protein